MANNRAQHIWPAAGSHADFPNIYPTAARHADIPNRGMAGEHSTHTSSPKLLQHRPQPSPRAKMARMAAGKQLQAATCGTTHVSAAGRGSGAGCATSLLGAARNQTCVYPCQGVQRVRASYPRARGSRGRPRIATQARGMCALVGSANQIIKHGACLVHVWQHTQRGTRAYSHGA